MTPASLDISPPAVTPSPNGLVVPPLMEDTSHFMLRRAPGERISDGTSASPSADWCGSSAGKQQRPETSVQFESEE